MLRSQGDPRAFWLTIFFIVCVRLVVESNLQATGLRIEILAHSMVDRLVFYAALGLVFLATLRHLLPGRPPGISNVISVGLLLGLLPPLLAALVPWLDGAGHGYLTGWQLHFYAPSEHALSRTVTLWLSVIACGMAVLSASASWARAIAAMVLAWLGLAWVMVMAPSMFPGDSALQGGASKGSLQAVLGLTCVALFMCGHPEILRDSMLRRDRQRWLVWVTIGGGWFAQQPVAEVAGRTVLVAWLLWATSRRIHQGAFDTMHAMPVPAMSDDRRMDYWTLPLAGLMLSILVFKAPLVSLTSCALLLGRVALHMMQGHTGSRGGFLGVVGTAFHSIACFAIGAAAGTVL